MVARDFRSGLRPAPSPTAIELPRRRWNSDLSEAMDGNCFVGKHAGIDVVSGLPKTE